MMLLVSSARGPEQVQAAMDLLRWDKMVRARQQRRYAPFSPHATRALLRVSRQSQATQLLVAIEPTPSKEKTRHARSSRRWQQLAGCCGLLAVCGAVTVSGCRAGEPVGVCRVTSLHSV